MLLVVDVVKGLQTQTAECLLIGEFTCPRMVVILNKTDLLAPEKRQSAIDKMTKRLHKTLESTRCGTLEGGVILLMHFSLCYVCLGVNIQYVHLSTHSICVHT